MRALSHLEHLGAEDTWSLKHLVHSFIQGTQIFDYLGTLFSRLSKNWIFFLQVSFLPVSVFLLSLIKNKKVP